MLRATHDRVAERSPLLLTIIKEHEQEDECCKGFGILDLSKGKQFVGHRNFSVHTLAPSRLGHHYLTDTMNSFEHLPQGKHSVLKRGLSQACTDGWLQLQPLWQAAKPSGTLPPAPTIHLVCWYNSTLLQPLLSVSQDTGQNVTIWTGLINGMKNGLPKHTSMMVACSSWRVWLILIKRGHYNNIFFLNLQDHWAVWSLSTKERMSRLTQ